MSNFKPCLTYQTRDSINEYRSSSRKSQYIHKSFPTYTELKKNLKAILEESIEDSVHVCRSKRGEWGEWNEYWSLVNGKLVKHDKGWS
jgi:hypothetical protein